MENSLATLVSAQHLLASGQVQQARAQLLPELANEQARAEVLYLLAIAAVMSEQPALATQHAEAAIAERAGEARYHFALGRAHKSNGQLLPAIAAYRQAVALNGEFAEAHVSLGIALKQGGDLQAAIASYEMAISLNPGLAVAHVNLAYARAALVERETESGVDELPHHDAIEHTERAAASAPGNALLQFNLGLLLRRARRRAEAIGAFNRALGISPHRVDYCLHLGRELTASGATQSAVVLYRRWQELNPPNPTVMRALANLLVREGAASAAIEWSERAAALEPDPKAYLQLCHTYQQCRRLDDALVAGRKAIELSGQDWQNFAIPLLVANYLLEDPQAIADLHVQFGRALAPALAPPLPRPARRARRAGEPLRVGYVSADFINHSVAFFVGPLLAHHDKRRFEVWCYHNRGWGDAMTEQLKSCGHHWVECEGMTDEALCRRIEADGIDILVDLAGHTSGARTRVFGMAPAPVQVAYLGYPTASGVQPIEHRISDATIDPGDIPHTGSERPLCLPRSMFCYRPPEEPGIAAAPSLQTGHVTFGSFNNLAKVTDACLDLWAQVLLSVPGSRLLLKSSSVADPANRSNIERHMALRGVAADRLDLRTQLEQRGSHFEAYNQVDVALDTYPYNGATTTCEALWMGVPVISLRGGTHSSRMGASILAAAGKPEWVAASAAQYVELAAATALDTAARQTWRLQARASLRDSPLLDEAGFSRDFESALCAAWAADDPVPA